MELFEVTKLDSFKEFLKKTKHPVLKYFKIDEIRKAKYSLADKDSLDQMFCLEINSGELSFVNGKKSKLKYKETL